MSKCNPEARAKALAHDRLVNQFDELINEYDDNRRLEVLIDEFLQSTDLRDRLVLDAGCGTGRGSHRLSDRGARVIALDIGFNLVGCTLRRCRCRATVGSVLSLPFTDNTFDVVFSTEVVEHTPSPLDTVLEMYRVLKPGGHLVLSTPNWLWQMPVRLASLTGLRPYDGFENFVKPAHLRKTLEDAGGCVVEHKGIHLLPFQLTAIQPMLRKVDAYGRRLLPVMINQCIHCIKPAAD
jgi:2-polyprenyl-3-methyl-5-hydroxy-6-metoxy-1,4-benzoquinol methylase